MKPSLLMLLVAVALLVLLIRHLANADERRLVTLRVRVNDWAREHGVSIDWAGGYYVYLDTWRRYLVVCGHDAHGIGWRYTLHARTLFPLAIHHQELLERRSVYPHSPAGATRLGQPREARLAADEAA